MGKAATPVVIPEGAIVTYQHNQMRKCGRPTCTRCKNGRGHGPYTYAYWREEGTEPRKFGQGFTKGRLRSKYLGLTARLQVEAVPDTSEEANVV